MSYRKDKPMLNTKFLDDLAKRLSDALPPSVKSVQDDLEKNFRSVLQGTFAKLELVTREEFDAQANVLARTRIKLEQLEQHVAALEAKTGGKTSS